jgi:hypothetical protein
MKGKYANRLFSATIITLLLLLGCGSTRYLSSGSKTYPPTSSVTIYYWDKPDRPYVEMGRIEVKARTEEGMLERFKEKAMKIGADGVDIRSVEDLSIRSNNLSSLLKAPIRAEGIAIKFKDVSPEK